VHDDRVQRDFTAIRPDLVWLTDITEHPTLEGKLYCCAIKDVFSNRIAGYALAYRMTADLAVAALWSAIARRRPSGPTTGQRLQNEAGAEQQVVTVDQQKGNVRHVSLRQQSPGRPLG
jgi:transposase InsO family protein